MIRLANRLDIETGTFVAFAGYFGGLGSWLAHRTFREVDISSSATQGFHYSNVADYTQVHRVGEAVKN